MNVSRVLSTAAKRAPNAIAASSKISQRGFAIAATQQAAQTQQQSSQSDAHRRVGGLLAAAAAASALAASNSNETADCCGIAGVVGGSADAR